MRVLALCLVGLVGVAILGMFAVAVQLFLTGEVGAAYGAFFGAFIVSSITGALVVAYVLDQEEGKA